MKIEWKVNVGVALAFIFIISLFSSFSLMAASENERIKFKPGNIDSLKNEMADAVVAFHVPTNINIADSSQIHLVLSFYDTVEKLKQLISEEGEEIGNKISLLSVK